MIKKIKKVLLDTFDKAKAIYIFGSYAKKNFKEDSDIDIAILYEEKLNPFFLFQKQEELSVILNKDIDLVDLQNIDDVFAYEIVNNSIKIKNSKFAEEYELRIWYRYLDLQDDRAEILKAFYG